MSVPLPGPSVRMNLTVRVGQLCADDGVAAISGAETEQRADNADKTRRIGSSGTFDCGGQ